jgi:hypothetical protein
MSRYRVVVQDYDRQESRDVMVRASHPRDAARRACGGAAMRGSVGRWNRRVIGGSGMVYDAPGGGEICRVFPV